MIKAKLQYKAPKLDKITRAVRDASLKALRPMARELKRKVKADVPRRSGALKLSVGDKVKSKKGRAYAVVGIKWRFGVEKKGRLKIPNLYNKYAKPALKANFNKGLIDGVLQGIRDDVIRSLK